MVDLTTGAFTIESTVGACNPRGNWPLGDGAGAGEGVLVAADGLGGHGTGWLGARLAVRVLVERFARPGTEVRFVGAAEAEATQSARWVGGLYEECAASLRGPLASPRDLAAVLSEIDRVMAARVPGGMVAGCIAATLEGARVHGVQAGIGRALLLRAGAHRFESLVVEHYMHLVADRMTKYRDLDPAQIPPNIIVNGLGDLATSEVGIDRFEVDLGAGDLLLLCSERFEKPEEEVAAIVREAVDDGAPLDDLARTLESRAAAMLDPAEPYRAREVAFAIAFARRRAG